MTDAPPLLSGLTRRWRGPSRSVVPAGPGTIAGEPVEPLVRRVLGARGLDGDSGAAFLDPRLTHLHDPSTLPDLDRAAERLLAALRSSEPVAIYGDYDVDGITATAILFHACRALAPGADVRTYVPHRLEEGYGLNAGAIRELASHGVRLIVSVDCGITAIEPALEASRAGVDLVITDHHTPPDRADALPSAYAVVHPCRPGSVYPFPHLSGAGVAYKLAWRLATMAEGSARVRPGLQRLLLDLLAFAALGTVADVVPLVGENRVLARFGLSRIRGSPFTGLASLVAASGLDGAKVDAVDVGFRLAPRLNACGRLGHAREAVELFTTATPERADEIAAMLTRRNEERRALEQRVTDEASRLAEAAGMTGRDRRAIVLAHPDWHQGVVGIACSRLVERYGRPTILMQDRDGSCHGSGRSVDGFSLHGALARCAAHLEAFGGHDMAAGLHLKRERLDAFTADFMAEANAGLAPEELTPCCGFDGEARLAELTPRAARQLGALGPFGRSNPEVRLLVRGVRLTSSPGLIGRHGAHLTVTIAQDGVAIRSIGWGWGEQARRLSRGDVLDALVVPRVSTWIPGTVECEIADLRPHDTVPAHAATGTGR